MWVKEKIDSYITPSNRKIPFLSKLFPNLSFYYNIVFKIVVSASRKSKKGIYDDEEWIKSSFNVLKLMENIGVNFEIEGRKNFYSFDGACVFVANHMSTLETFVLPCLIHPLKPITFIVKESLLEYPIFKHVMKSRNPVPVTRQNPREDFKRVMTMGTERIKQGLSIVVFPQTTRTTSFAEDKFNSIGVKLAKKAGVPIIPIALKTDAWGTGKLIKDFGPINTQKKVYFSFGPVITKEKIANTPKEAHQEVINFIKQKLELWRE